MSTTAATPAATGGEVDVGNVRALPGYERGRPVYFDNEVVDHLVTVVLELGAELWILRDRQAHTEELLAARGIDLSGELDKGRPSEALQAKLKAERERVIARVYGALYSKYGGDKAAQQAAILKMT